MVQVIKVFKIFVGIVHGVYTDFRGEGFEAFEWCESRIYGAVLSEQGQSKYAFRHGLLGKEGFAK